MPAISAWLNAAAKRLSEAGIPSARLDAEVILAHTIRKSRTYLHAHDDELLTDRFVEIADARIELRLDRTPVAYIIGHKEFYGRLFKVTPATLIPRPESEDLIDMLKEIYPTQTELLPSTPLRLVDVGTGSGCLGITAKLELPALDVTLLDISRHALNVAKTNALRLDADVTLEHSNLLGNYPFAPVYIIANLPYVDPSWERSPETEHEPQLALFADDGGLRLINELIDQSARALAQKGYILLEADPRQHTAIISAAKNRGFHLVDTRGFALSFQKI
jgi:release factor glutamine methyltransferase